MFLEEPNIEEPLRYIFMCVIPPVKQIYTVLLFLLSSFDYAESLYMQHLPTLVRNGVHCQLKYEGSKRLILSKRLKFFQLR